MAPRQRPWTPFEDNFIREHYRTMTYKEIATVLGRTDGTVGIRALLVLKLKKRRSRTLKVIIASKKKKPAVVIPFSFSQTPCAERELGWTK